MSSDLEIRQRALSLSDKVADWSIADLLEQLRSSYAPTHIPPCRVCGGKLSPQSIGGGPTVWACSPYEDDPERPGYVRHRADRKLVDEHYALSKFVDHRCGGDERVIELIRRFEVVESGRAETGDT